MVGVPRMFPSDEMSSPGGREPELTRMLVQPGQGSLTWMSIAYDEPAVAAGQT